LFDGLKKVQRKNGLQVDGVARPGGPTETVINSSLARRSTGTAFGTLSDNGTANRTRDKDPSPGGLAQRKKKPPTSFGLATSIGDGYANRGSDVRETKRALAWAGYYPRADARTPTDSPDEAMREGIHAFQRDFSLKRDGILHPGGETQMRLDEVITPLVQLAATKLAQTAEATPTTPTDGGAMAQPPSQPPPRAEPDAPPPEEEPPPTQNAPALNAPNGDPSESPKEEDPNEANCAALWAKVEATRAELKQLEEDIALITTPAKDSDRTMTWRYVQLLNQHTGYSTAPPEDIDGVLQVLGFSTPGASKDGGAATKRTQIGKNVGSVAGAMHDAMFGNPELVEEARRSTLKALAEIKKTTSDRLDSEWDAFRNAGGSSPTS
jgi:peptidoglycan hydrolase-like protein with peptidoglycan-binding domain